MKATDFCTSQVFTFNKFTYVVIAEHCNDLSPNWAPARETSFALNELIREFFGNTLIECQEGIYESAVSPVKLEKQMRSHGFIYNAVLDEIMNNFIDQ